VPGSVAGLPGWLYFVEGDRLVRLTGSGPQVVLSSGGYSASVSPDGGSVAYVDDGADVVVVDRDGRRPRTVLRGSVIAGFEPVWSPDSRRLLAVKNAGEGRVTFGVVTVASGSFAPLAHQLDRAIHPLWSADGRHLGYATGTCQIGVADVDGGNARVVPVFGDMSSAANPQRRRSCDPYSMSVDGRLVAVNQRTGDEEDGDIGRDLVADAVVDTRTGEDVALPVSGQISAVLFLPSGEILVRSGGAGGRQLTLLNPDRSVKTRVVEPATVANANLLAYTPN
jgi:TolB protein